jgi:hypothetical protein
MRHQKFTHVDLTERPMMSSLITKGPAFQFDMSDIARIREEIGTLIDNLSPHYLQMKAQEKETKKKEAQEKEAKKKAKRGQDRNVKMQQWIEHKNGNLINMRGDGRCLFYGLAHIVNTSVDQLIASIKDEIVKNKDDYIEFLTPDRSLPPSAPTPDPVAAWSQTTNSIGNIQGDNLTIAAVANIYNMGIVLFQSGFNNGYIEFHPKSRTSSRRGHLFRELGKSMSHAGSDNHYQVVEFNAPNVTDLTGWKLFKRTKSSDSAATVVESDTSEPAEVDQAGNVSNPSREGDGDDELGNEASGTSSKRTRVVPRRTITRVSNIPKDHLINVGAASEDAALNLQKQGAIAVPGQKVSRDHYPPEFMGYGRCHLRALFNACPAAAWEALELGKTYHQVDDVKQILKKHVDTALVFRLHSRENNIHHWVALTKHHYFDDKFKYKVELFGVATTCLELLEWDLRDDLASSQEEILRQIQNQSTKPTSSSTVISEESIVASTVISEESTVASTGVSATAEKAEENATTSVDTFELTASLSTLLNSQPTHSSSSAPLIIPLIQTASSTKKRALAEGSATTVSVDNNKKKKRAPRTTRNLSQVCTCCGSEEERQANHKDGFTVEDELPNLLVTTPYPTAVRLGCEWSKEASLIRRHSPLLRSVANLDNFFSVKEIADGTAQHQCLVFQLSVVIQALLKCKVFWLNTLSSDASAIVSSSNPAIELALLELMECEKLATVLELKKVGSSISHKNGGPFAKLRMELSKSHVCWQDQFDLGNLMKSVFRQVAEACLKWKPIPTGQFFEKQNQAYFRADLVTGLVTAINLHQVDPTTLPLFVDAHPDVLAQADKLRESALSKLSWTIQMHVRSRYHAFYNGKQGQCSG